MGVDLANRLVRFDADDLGTTSSIAISGLESAETIVGIDVRPSNGELLALGSTSRIYVIDPSTGIAIQRGGQLAPALVGTTFGFDVNPVADRLRIQTSAAENLRLDPDTGALAGTDSVLTFAVGDTNESATPSIAGDAYMVPGTAGTTSLYAIDSALDVLVLSPMPNLGGVQTVGPLDIDATGDVGFDIVPVGLAIIAYAAMTPSGATVSTLYTIDLATGRATSVGTIGGARLVALSYFP